MAETPRNHVMLEAGETRLNIHPAYTLLQAPTVFFYQKQNHGPDGPGSGCVSGMEAVGWAGGWALPVSIQCSAAARAQEHQSKAGSSSSKAGRTHQPGAASRLMLHATPFWWTGTKTQVFNLCSIFLITLEPLLCSDVGAFSFSHSHFYIGFLSLCLIADGYFLQLLLCLISCFFLALLGPSLVPHPSPKTFNCKSGLLKRLRKRERPLERGVTPFPSSLSFSLLPEEESLTQTLLFFLRQSGHESLFTAEVQVSNRIVK